jgi:uncharacterized protein YndB with AHSA1/START domain
VTELPGVLRTLPDQLRAVRFERTYAAAVDDVWSALTEPERVARWLDPITGERQVGGTVVVHFDDGDATLEVTECAPPHRLAVRWRHAPDRVSEVTVTVEAAGAGSLLVLDHTLLAASSAPGYAAGWHWHLRALGAVLRGEEREPWSTFDALYADYERATS